MAKNIRILGWSVSFGIISLATLIIFILALKVLFMDIFSKWALPIAITSGIFLAIFLIVGTLSIKAIIRRIRI